MDEEINQDPLELLGTVVTEVYHVENMKQIFAELRLHQAVAKRLKNRLRAAMRALNEQPKNTALETEMRDLFLSECANLSVSASHTRRNDLVHEIIVEQHHRACFPGNGVKTSQSSSGANVVRTCHRKL